MKLHVSQVGTDARAVADAPAGRLPKRLAWPVCVAAVLDAVDGHDLTIVVDPVDDAVVAATCGEEAGEFTEQWLPDASRSFCQRPQHHLEGGGSDFLGKSVEVA